MITFFFCLGGGGFLLCLPYNGPQKTTLAIKDPGVRFERGEKGLDLKTHQLEFLQLHAAN